VTSPPTPVPLQKFATTTRYWDCSGGACGCAYLPFAGQDQKPAMCHSNAMFDAPADNSHGAKFYGTAAISQGLGGGNWLADACGKCWKVTGKSNAPGYEDVETTLVLKGVNYCPPGNIFCANDNPHFDIAAPGFDVTEFSLSNTCAEREADEVDGFAACGRWLIDSNNPDENCDCSLFIDPVLRAGCDNFLSLMWDNSPVQYEEVGCPTELSRLNCWEDNGDKYPVGIPEFCANNDPDAPTPAPTDAPKVTPTGSPTGSPTKDCGSKMNLKVEILNDSKSDKLRYIVHMKKKKKGWKKIMKKRNLEVSKQYTKEKCVNPKKCYRFMIIDPEKDGIFSDEHGKGYFKIYWDGEVLTEEFATGSKRTIRFGKCFKRG